MAVVSVDELWAGRTGSDGITRQRDYTRVFQVRTSSPADDATVAGGPQARLLGLPGNGYPYPVDAFSRVVKIRPDQQAEDPTLWLVSVDYSTNLPWPQARETQGFDPASGESKESPTGLDPTARPENPLDRDPVYEVDYEEATEIVTHTAAGFPVLNSADLPYDPPLEDERSYAVVTVTKNLAVVKFDWLDQFVDSVNSVKWMNRPVRTCRIKNIGYRPKSENGVNFWEVRFRIKIRPQKWDKLVAEAGYYEVVSDGSGGWNRPQIPVPSDAAGREVAGPYPLNGNRVGVVAETDYLGQPTGVMDISGVTLNGRSGRGSALATAGGTGGPPQLVYTRWRLKPEKDFSALGI